MSPSVFQVVSSLFLFAGQPEPAASTATASEASQQAMQAFEAGQRLFQDAEYELALAAFLRAMELRPAPELHYNIALCHSRLGDDLRAITAFEAYLEQTDPPDRADVEHQIDDARERIALREAAERSVAPEPRVVAVEPHRPLVVAGASLMAVGLGIGVGGAVGFGVAVQRHNEPVEDFNAGRSDLTMREAFEHEMKAYRYEALQYAALGVGAAATIGGVAMLATGLHRRARADRVPQDVQVAPTAVLRGSGIMVRGRF